MKRPIHLPGAVVLVRRHRSTKFAKCQLELELKTVKHSGSLTLSRLPTVPNRSRPRSNAKGGKHASTLGKARNR